MTYYTPISSSALANAPSVGEMFAKIGSAIKLIDWSLVGNMSIYNAPEAKNLHNEGYQIGGAIGNGCIVAVDYNVVPNNVGPAYKGGTFSVGKGSVDIHGAMGYTISLITSRISVYDLIEAAYNGVYGR